MTRYVTRTLALGAILALAASAAWSQGWGAARGGRGGGRGGRWVTVESAQSQPVFDLHEKVRQAQWELWTLKANDADPAKIKQKTNEVNELRYEMSRLKTELPPGPGFEISQTGNPVQSSASPGWFGRGRRGNGYGGFGRGAGLGRGWNRWGGGPGPCWWGVQSSPGPTTEADPVQ